MAGTTQVKKLTKGDIFRSWVIWLFFSHANYNWERLQGGAFAHAMIPIIRRLYSTPEEIRAALKRHLVFFNTEPNWGGMIHGITISMEEARANGAEIDDDTINAVKSGLMGPMAGVGDSITQGLVFPVMLSIGIGMASQGSLVGPFLYVLVVAAYLWGFGWVAYYQGYVQGQQLITRLLESGLLDKVRLVATILGSAVVGALAATFVRVSTPLTFTSGQTKIEVQKAILDRLMPGLLPLATVLIVFWLVKRGVSPTKIMVGIFVVSLVGKLLKVF
jgi:mannose PTS system EIID component